MHLEEKISPNYHSWWLVGCSKLNIKQSVMTISVLYKVRESGDTKGLVFVKRWSVTLRVRVCKPYASIGTTFCKGRVAKIRWEFSLRAFKIIFEFLKLQDVLTFFKTNYSDLVREISHKKLSSLFEKKTHSKIKMNVYVFNL